MEETLYLTTGGWIPGSAWIFPAGKFGEPERPFGTIAVWRKEHTGAYLRIWTNARISEAFISALLRRFPRDEKGIG